MNGIIKHKNFIIGRIEEIYKHLGHIYKFSIFGYWDQPQLYSRFIIGSVFKDHSWQA